MTRLSVLFVTPWYPTREQPAWGIFVREHAKAVRLYDDVVVVHLRKRQSVGRQFWQLEEELDTALTEDVPTFRLWYPPLPIPKAGFAGQVWAMLGAVRSLVATGFRPDIVHAHVYASAVAALATARMYSVPLVVSEHSTDFPRQLLGRFDTWAVRRAFAGAALVLPVSNELQKWIERHGIRARFRVVPNAVDVDLFHPPGRTRGGRAIKRLLFVGLFDAAHKKGVPYLLRALSDLTRSDWHLDMLGDGPVRGQYEGLAHELGIAAHVSFHGLQPKCQVAEFMREADLFVLPSLWENLPCVVIEAMATGLPILATNVGGIPEIVDESVGRLVPPMDVRGLRDTLDVMLDTLPQFDCGAISARAQRYSLKEVGQSLAHLYRTVIK